MSEQFTFNTPEAGYATQFINSTNRHVFLTGRAGTGKTTLLKQLVANTHKKTLIAAPTGIAAINAGGVTLHSLFHLPFGTFVPSNNPDFSYRVNTAVNTPQSLIKNLKMNAQKRQLLRELELLIVDEVSMLRADILDAIDTVLRYVRRQNHQPFGGLQILFIGDLWQLPPVVKNDEVNFLKQYYSNFYFFCALALKQQPPVYIELEHIYRQTDKDFIQLLNHFRVNQVTQPDIDLLNTCYRSDFSDIDKTGYISLTTHNNKADAINRESLDKLNGKIYRYKATIQGDFGENIYPVEPTLELKKGAQVMFLKNDYSGESAYYNGKIGEVSGLSSDFINVKFHDGSKDAQVELYTWENKKFRLKPETNELEENIIGRFTHFPIKLAWAITIHKSQGLTFEKAIIDISEVFASGQTYVALSRMTALSGLILSKPAKVDGISPDNDITTFANQKKAGNELSADLQNASVQYAKDEAIKAFNFWNILNHLTDHKESYNKDAGKSPKQKFQNWCIELIKHFSEINQVAQKFQSQLSQLAQSQQPDSLSNILERVSAAKLYFEPLFNELSQNTAYHITEVKREKGIKKYTTELKTIDGLFYNQIIKFNKAEMLIQSILSNTQFNKKNIIDITNKIGQPKSGATTKAGEKEKTEKVDTKTLTLQLYKQGKTISEIAKERNLTAITIEGHLSVFVAKGEIPIDGLVDEHKIEPIIEAAKEFDTLKLSPIKEYLGSDYSYTEIRFGVALLVYQKFIAKKQA